MKAMAAGILGFGLAAAVGAGVVMARDTEPTVTVAESDRVVLSQVEGESKRTILTYPDATECRRAAINMSAGATEAGRPWSFKCLASSEVGP